MPDEITTRTLGKRSTTSPPGRDFEVYFLVAFWTEEFRRFQGTVLTFRRLKERKKQKGKVRWLLGHTGVQYFEGLVVLVLERMEFNISKRCGLSMDHWVSDEYRLSLNNNNCTFINK
ncbi:unnamed protein product [Rhizophagus irregularis]|uniref:Uncharacterized protein n=1 Tax=Rhizophagus irregularis TaxID=588596 RepID=A0A915ZVU6_9GLOM|nr:unnamed protein product [Rhizophagus irregularis]